MDKKVYERPIIVKQYSGMMNKFGSTAAQKPKTEIDNVPVKDILEKYGSPVFVFSEKQIRDNQRKMNRIFKSRYPKVQFAWSYKTNYLNSICSIFHQEGSWAEVVSEFEFDKAISLGVPGKFIIFNGPQKSETALKKAIDAGAKIHIDHFDELYKLIELSENSDKQIDVAVRVNMDVGIYPKWDRFGFNYENGEAQQVINRILLTNNLRLVGLHTHIGTYIMSTEPYRKGVAVLVELANYIKEKQDVTLKYIDVGGGLPSHNTLKGQYLNAEQILPSYEQYADAITSPLYEYKASKDSLPTLILESGRALIDNAGYLLSTVIGNKRLANGKRAVIIDAGVNLLFTSHWFKHKIVPAQQSGTFTENSTVYGPLCMNIDCISEDSVLPPLKIGENVVLYYVGAYSVTQWMQFITTRPNVVLVSEAGEVELIREKENLEQITSMEKKPERLGNFTLQGI
ncbi:MAG: diaminopimelate decarboxylase [Ignavibacteriae bacterium]|nr:diaminopimelate decarboxylase [Ignavibacteriota bacterium]